MSPGVREEEPKFVPKPLGEAADASRGDRSWTSFLKNSISVVLILTLLYLGLGLLADLVAARIPDRWEARLFSRQPLPDDGASSELSRARNLFEGLIQAPDLRALDYSLFEIPTGRPNAEALPGGAVGLTAGLLKSVESEVGLVMVLGHELGHHQHRHSLKKMGRALLLDTAMALLFGSGGEVVTETTLSLAESSHSRGQEIEADEFALRLVFARYGHTEGSLELFELIRRENEREGSRWASFLASHPLTADRIEHLQAYRSTLADSDQPSR